MSRPPSGGSPRRETGSGAAARVAAVVIGRDEGATLGACLDRLCEQCERVVYVDSGSVDESVPLAEARGVAVQRLGALEPFPPGLARNAGFRAIERSDSRAEFIQFVDGDCVLEADWVPQAVEALDADAARHVVCGQLLEVDAKASLWKRLCQIEWSAPVGPVDWSGGIFMVRRDVFRAQGGFREDMVAGEEPELCTRIRDAGGSVERLDLPMACHESHMHSFAQFWRREYRGGYMDFGVRTESGEQPFALERFRCYAWTLGWLVLTALLMLVGGSLGGTRLAVVGGALGVAVLPVQMLRQMHWCRRQGHDHVSALVYGVMVVLLNWPKLLGQLRYHWDRRSASARSVSR